VFRRTPELTVGTGTVRTPGVSDGLGGVDAGGRHKRRVERAAPMLLVAALLALMVSACATSSRSAADAPAKGGGNTPGTVASGAMPPEAAAGETSGGNMEALNSRLFRRAASPDTPSDLPLGAGDLIEISVVDVPELSARKVRVPREGGIGLPLLGEVPVTGRSAADVEEDLRRRLQAKYMHDPQVSVFVHERRSQRISVLGAVKKGGVLELSGRLRLADALAMAEGLTDDADHVVYVFRQTSTTAVTRAQARQGQGAATAPAGPAPATTDVMTTIDLEAIANGNEELNVPLEAGDVIQVPRAGSVYVGGSVARPGSIQLKGTTTVHQAIVSAGGASNVAALADVRLYRKKPDGQVEITTLDLDQFEAGKDAPVVQKNDVIIVGKSAIKAFLWGTYDLFRGVFGVGVGL
jgi:polysaccharide export outer membrane protein